MKIETRQTVRLSVDEVKEAIREYIELHSVGQVSVTEHFNLYLIVEDGGRHSDVEMEAVLFE